MLIQRLLVTGLLLFFIISGCSSTDDDNATGPEDGHPPAEMIGTWIFQAVTVDSVPASLALVMEWVPDAVQARFHVVNDIGSFVYEEVNLMGGQLYAASGFVYVEGNEIDINLLQDHEGNELDETIFMTFALEADTLTLNETDQGQAITYTLYRKQ